MATLHTPAAPAHLIAAQALSRAAGAPLLGGNALELLIDAAAHFEAWLTAIRGAQRRVLLQNYIVRDDQVGRSFRDALVERARAGVFVAVIVDSLGCLSGTVRMLHAKTAVADGQWARVGSSNLNVSSWLGNYELDVAVEDAGFASLLATQFERDLHNATELVLASRPRRRLEQILDRGARSPKMARAGGSVSRAAAGALRIANTVGAAISTRRVLGDLSAGPLLTGVLILAVLTVVAFLWPRWIAWPFGTLAGWLALNLLIRHWRTKSCRRAR